MHHRLPLLAWRLCRRRRAASSAGTMGNAQKFSLLRSGEYFPGVTDAVRAFQGNFLCGTWLRNELPATAGVVWLWLLVNRESWLGLALLRLEEEQKL